MNVLVCRMYFFHTYTIFLFHSQFWLRQIFHHSLFSTFSFSTLYAVSLPLLPPPPSLSLLYLIHVIPLVLYYIWSYERNVGMEKSQSDSEFCLTFVCLAKLVDQK